jgi:predicted dehydrogenase
MKILLAGLGSIGMRHARNFRSLGAAVLGMDPATERRERFTAEFGAPAVPSLAEGLDLDPDVVVVGSPNRFHIDQATAAAEAGRHLLIEKPLGISMDGIDTLVRTIERRKLFAHVGSNFKFHPALQTMKRLLDEGALGRVTAAQVLAGQWLPGWHPTEDYRKGYSARADLGGGIVLDTHEFDYLLWLLGPVASATGFAHRSGALEVETEDVACAAIHFASGVLATVQVDYIQRDYRRRYHISGDAGTMEWDFKTGRLSLYRVSTGATEVLDVSDEINSMYVRQAQHVLDAAASGAPPVTSVEHAARVLELQLQIRSSRV